MIKRPSSRSSRSRGFKLKHALQICLLLGVCFWLVYQVKHSHAKKEELEKKDAQSSVKTQNSNTEVNLGRKSLHPRVEEEKNEGDEDEEAAVEEDESRLIEKQVLDDNKHEGDEREEETGKSEEEAEDEESKNEKEEIDEEDREDGNKRDEEVKDDENKHEEELRNEENNGEEEEREEGNRQEDEERDDGEGENDRDDEEKEEETKSERTVEEGRVVDGEMDEHDQLKIGDGDRDENPVDEEKEIEEIAENESTNEDGETGKEGQVDQEASAEDQDKNAENHEAREKHYTGDDASSAVTHDTQIVSSELENPSINGSNENAIISNLEQNMNSSSINVISREQNSTLELSDVKTEEQLPKNATNEQQLVEDKPVASGSTEIPVTSDMDKPHNETVNGTDNIEVSNPNTTELEPNSTSTVSDKTENNITVTVAEDISSASNLELDVSNGTTKPEVADPEVDSGSSRETEETRNENSDQNGSDRADESSGLSTSDGAGDGVHDVDPIDTTDTSVGQDEKEARMDLDTLPENMVEGVHSRDAAAE